MILSVPPDSNLGFSILDSRKKDPLRLHDVIRVDARRVTPSSTARPTPLVLATPPPRTALLVKIQRRGEGCADFRKVTVMLLPRTAGDPSVGIRWSRWGI